MAARRRASELLLPGNDFWVFDDRLVLWNHFTGEGEVSPEGWEITEDLTQVKVCAAAFESVWDRAVSHENTGLPDQVPGVRLHYGHLVDGATGQAADRRSLAGDPARRWAD